MGVDRHQDKDYSDVLYVEELIGPNTVNTVPPATSMPFPRPRQGALQPRGEFDKCAARARRAREAGISLDAITAELVKDGVKLFGDSADKLYGAVAHKRATVLGGGIDAQKLALGDGHQKNPSRKAPKSGAPRPKSAGSGTRTNRLDRR